ncbi:MAG: carboxynorspermidine decarboxylase [Pseudomonadales bacterium]|nr:carboxynorspermidine decarboxylase [Pseudomonadales bacterium]
MSDPHSGGLAATVHRDNGLAADTFARFDPARVPSPCFVVDEVAIERNLQILHRVERESGAKVLLALKAFSMFALAPLVRRYLRGTCASGLWEARLGREEYGGEVHVYSAAFTQADLKEILGIADHVVFNTLSQWQHFQPLIRDALGERPELDFGLRINPRHSEGAVPLYDPCAPGSRLGTPIAQLAGQDLSGFSGLHFHTLCEQNFAPLARTLDAVEAQCGDLLDRMEWVNFGGGHHISHPSYDVDGLIARIRHFSERYGVQVYLEPGEAIAIRSGVLVSEVLDLMHNGMPLGILDCSATCHMPDTLEMPYRAHIKDSSEPGQLPHTYRLGGLSCLAGDVMGDYSFAEPLQVGQRLVFDDMAHYTMVKTTTFNGVRLPALAVWNSVTDDLRIVREFGYQDFRNRLS